MTNGRFLVPRPPRTNRHVVLDVNKKCRGFRWRRFVGFEPASNSREFTYGSNFIKTLVTLQFLCRREQSWTCANSEIWWQLRYGVFLCLHSGIGFLTRQKQLKQGLLLLNLRLFSLIYCRISGIMFLPVFAVALLCQTATSFSIFR